MMNKAKITLITSLIFLFVSISNAQGVQVLERKIISNQVTDCDMDQMELIFNDNNNILIVMDKLLYVDNNLIRIGTLTIYDDKDNPIEIKGNDEFCCRFLGGFIKDNEFYIVFEDVNTINVYNVQKKPLLINRVKSLTKSSHYYNYDKVISISQQSRFYLLGHDQMPSSKPVEFIKILMSGGHGVFYREPFLAEVQNDKIIKYIKLDFDGKTDESFIAKEIVIGGAIHLLGFRKQELPVEVAEKSPMVAILYYMDYDIKNEETSRKHTIHQNALKYNKSTDTYCDYGVLSADGWDDDVFAVFSWVEQKHFKQGSKFKQKFNINDVNSSIYFWQCSDKSCGKAKKIAEGFCPLVRVDQFGDVHVFWIDRNGNIVQKVKTNGKWGDEEIILSGFSTKPAIIYTKYCVVKVDEDRPEAILYTKFVAAEFDKDNNLHMVYPTAEGIVYIKLKLE